MLPEKWQSLIGEIKDKFEVSEQGSEHLEDDGGTDIEFIVFQSPLGLLRMEFVTKPVVIDKKTRYSNRFGAETQVDYVYSEEKIHKMDVYKWDEGSEEWTLIDNKNFII